MFLEFFFLIYKYGFQQYEYLIDRLSLVTPALLINTSILFSKKFKPKIVKPKKGKGSFKRKKN